MRVRIWGRVFLLSKKKCALYILLLLIICACIGYILISRFSTTTDEDIIDNTVFFTPKVVVDTTAEPSIKHTPHTIAVHITGCVIKPGVIYLGCGGILQDAIDLAGGFTSDADTAIANLAMKLSDGMQIKIPSMNDSDKNWLIHTGKATCSSSMKNSESTPSSKININTASITELMTLSGIGESTAKSIVKHREENGLFTKIEDIMNVPGIKEGKYNKIKDDICVSS